MTQLFQAIEHLVHQIAMEVLDIQELIGQDGRLRFVIDNITRTLAITKLATFNPNSFSSQTPP
ncbi:hypothetical protein LINPERPRIM_LOCUS444 [Linum perenne]